MSKGAVLVVMFVAAVVVPDIMGCCQGCFDLRLEGSNNYHQYQEWDDWDIVDLSTEDTAPPLPKADQGEPCQQSPGCKTGLKCEDVCTHARAGEYCTPNIWCQPGLWCDFKAQKATCKQKGAADGAVCSDIAASCLPPLKCICDSHACQCSAGAVGSWCASDSDCKPGNYCPTGEEKSVCYAGLPGDPCTGKPDECQPGSECNTSGLPDTPGFCRTVLETGEACDLADTLSICDDGLICSNIVDPPVCVQIGGLGFPCAMESLCDVQLVCNKLLDPPRCTETVATGDPCLSDYYCSGGDFCAPLLDVCSDGLDEAPCLATADCLSGNICLEESGRCSSGIYKSVCEGDGQGTCLDGLYCLPDPAAQQATTCWEGLPGDLCSGPGQCNEGLTCTGNGGESQCLTLQGLGEPCGGAPYVLCDSGLTCHPELHLCCSGNQDSPCLSDDDCATGALCDDNSHSCSTGWDFWPCTDDDDCQAGYYCVAGSGTCHSGEQGTPCDDDDDCEPLHLCDTTLDEALCHLPGSEGDTCLENLQCAADHYCHEDLQKCFDGSGGDPCESDDQCKLGLCDQGECY